MTNFTMRKIRRLKKFCSAKRFQMVVLLLIALIFSSLIYLSVKASNYVSHYIINFINFSFEIKPFSGKYSKKLHECDSHLNTSKSQK